MEEKQKDIIGIILWFLGAAVIFFLINSPSIFNSKNDVNDNQQNIINRDEQEEIIHNCLERCDEYNPEECFGPDGKGKIDQLSDCDLNKCMNDCMNNGL